MKSTKKQKFKIGDNVKWICNPKCDNEPFEVRGKIENIYTTTIAGFKKSYVARIKVLSKKYYNMYSSRKYTSISLDKLSLHSK